MKTKQICCQGEHIGDIKLKGGALDFEKLARLVCQQTSANPMLQQKKSDREPAKKKDFCVLCLKLANFFMIEPPTKL